MARILAEGAVASGVAPQRRGRLRDLGVGHFARIAAVALVVVGSCILGLAGSGETPRVGESVLAKSSPAARPVATMLPAAPARAPETEGLPVFVRRTTGREVLLTWAGDGRDVSPKPGETTTYRVLASDSPADFSQARPVEVAGSTLVASLALPSGHLADRTITYFRVE